MNSKGKEEELTGLLYEDSMLSLAPNILSLKKLQR